jgi:cation:H+ antiporter
MPGTWVQFAICATLIGYAGGRLAHYGDIIGNKAGWSGSWVGLILLSTVTSLPELVTGISAAGFANKPDIAAGDIFGSCAFNLLILAMLDAFHRTEPLYCGVRQDHALSAAFGLVLLATSGAVLVLGKRLDGMALGHVGAISPVVLALYLLAMRTIGRQDARRKQDGPAPRHGDIGMRRAIAMYALAALVVVAAGARLPFVAVRLAELMGWQNSFVGTLFVAAATSLPELSVSLTALRLGQADMAVSNILGSNMFNVAMLAVDDLAYRPGPLLSNVAPVHALTVFAALAMGATAIAALLARPRTRALGAMSWYSVAIVAVFALSSYAQYRFGTA